MAAPDPLSIRRAARTISRALIVDDLARKSARALAEISGADRAVLVIGDSIVADASRVEGGTRVTVRHGKELPPALISEEILRSVEERGASVVTHEEGVSSFWAHDGRGRPPSTLALSMLESVDSLEGRRVLGTVYLESARTDAFEPAHVEAVELLLDLCAASLANAQSYDALALRLDAEHRELMEAIARGADAAQRLRAQERLASLGTIASGIAHEIKNPLNFINNFAEISVGLTADLTAELHRLRASIGPDGAAYLGEIASDLAQNVGKIHEHGRRADGIVKGMLEHARGRAGHSVDIELNTLVREYATSAAKAQHGSSAASAGLELTLDPAVGKARVVPEELGRVILNLVSNGLDAARAQKLALGDSFIPLVHVSTRSLGDRVEVRVRDNGGGIPESIRDKVYQPFFTTKPAGEGTGLGLPLSREIVVDRHGGEIAFETEPGLSTEFVVTLPRRGPKPLSEE